MTEHLMDRTHWDRLKRMTRARLDRKGLLAEPLAPGQHDVEYDTHRTHDQRVQDDLSRG